MTKSEMLAEKHAGCAAGFNFNDIKRLLVKMKNTMRRSALSNGEYCLNPARVERWALRTIGQSIETRKLLLGFQKYFWEQTNAVPYQTHALSFIIKGHLIDQSASECGKYNQGSTLTSLLIGCSL